MSETYKKVRKNTFHFKITSDLLSDEYVIEMPADPCTLSEKEAKQMVEKIEAIRYVLKEFSRHNEHMMKAIEAALPIGTHWQSSNGIVYRTIQPEWKSVKMEHFGIERTRFEGLERAGGMSQKTAELLGYKSEK